MKRGIIVFGAPGSGTSTIGRTLADKLKFSHIETDDISGVTIDSPPFRISRTLDERIALLHETIAHCGNFVISGSMWDWGETFIPLFDLAIFVTTTTNIRIKRIEKREYERHGERIHTGGDMYDRHQGFVDWAKSYDTDNPDRSLKLHEDWIRTLPCPVLRIDGSISVNENIAKIMRESVIDDAKSFYRNRICI